MSLHCREHQDAWCKYMYTIFDHNHLDPPLKTPLNPPPPFFHKVGLREETGTNFCELSETWAVY